MLPYRLLVKAERQPELQVNLDIFLDMINLLRIVNRHILIMVRVVIALRRGMDIIIP